MTEAKRRALAALRALAAQLEANSAMLRGAGAAAAEFSPVWREWKPIPPHVLPPGMRNGGIARDFAAELVAKHEAGQYVDAQRLDVARRVLARAHRKQQAQHMGAESVA